MPRYTDSLSKIVTSYIAPMSTLPLMYEDKTFAPKPLRISPGIFSGYTCPAKCGACCPRFSLEYLPQEPHPVDLISYYAKINGKQIEFLHDTQGDHDDHFCRHLNRVDGRCEIHSYNPFHCDFELLRVHNFKDHYELNQRLYGRAWNMLRIDGERGAACEMLPHNTQWREDVLRRLRRLKGWIKHMRVGTKRINAVIAYVATGPHTQPLWIGAQNDIDAAWPQSRNPR